MVIFQNIGRFLEEGKWHIPAIINKFIRKANMSYS